MPTLVMTSNRSYLIRALHEWILDNGMTPQLLVDAHREGVRVPPGHVQDGKIVLNVAPRAVQGLTMNNDAISFRARFSGVPEQVSLPPDAVLAIYARENGQGMAFADGTPAPEGPDDEPPEPDARPRLRVVK